jgi:chromosome segregation ATPase
LEQDLEKVELSLRKRKEESEKAEKERSEYNANSESLQSWLDSVEDRMQVRDEPQQLKGKIVKIAGELPSILEKLERTKIVSKHIVDNTPDTQEAELVKKRIASLETDLSRVNRLLDERMNLVRIVIR